MTNKNYNTTTNRISARIKRPGSRKTAENETQVLNACLAILEGRGCKAAEATPDQIDQVRSEVQDLRETEIIAMMILSRHSISTLERLCGFPRTLLHNYVSARRKLKFSERARLLQVFEAADIHVCLRDAVAISLILMAGTSRLNEIDGLRPLRGVEKSVKELFLDLEKVFLASDLYDTYKGVYFPILWGM